MSITERKEIILALIAKIQQENADVKEALKILFNE